MEAKSEFHSFADFDRFRETLRGWDTEPTQLTSGKLSLHWDQLAFDDMSISRLRTNLKIADRMAYRAHHIGFVVCLGSKIFCGQPVCAGSLVVFRPGREYRNVLDENWESFEISMASRLFQSLSFATDVDRRIAQGPECSVLSLSPHLAAAFRAWSANFLAPFRLQPGLMDELNWTSAIREHTLSLLTQIFHDSGCASLDVGPLDHVQGWSLAARALDYVDQHAHDRLTIQQISQAMDRTTRALEIAFNRALGIAPLQYVLARRLHNVRRDLLLRTNGTPTVTHTAAHHGFVHFGRLSQQYRRLFGELPSETVMRASNVAVNRTCRRQPVAFLTNEDCEKCTWLGGTA